MKTLLFLIAVLIFLPLQTARANPDTTPYGVVYFEEHGDKYAIAVGDSLGEEHIILYRQIDLTPERERRRKEQETAFNKVIENLDYEVPDNSGRKNIQGTGRTIPRATGDASLARQRALVRKYPHLSIVDINTILRFEFPSGVIPEHVNEDGTIDLVAHYERVNNLPVVPDYRWITYVVGQQLRGKNDYDMPDIIATFQSQMKERLKREYARPLDKKELIREIQSRLDDN